MPSYREPSFQERAALAQKAKQEALDRLRAKAPVDEATVARRRQAAELREAKQANAREEKLAARELEKTRKRDQATLADPAKDATAPLTTEEERKAARDAKYAARKKRKK